MSNMSKLLAHSTETSQRTEDVLSEDNITFESLLLPERVLSGLNKNGFIKPSPIQLKAIPLGRCGYDLIVKSKSGTGKTLIFTVIALENIDVNKETVQVLIVAPAREIAVQIQDVITQLGNHIIGLKIQSFIGGLSLSNDKEKCKQCHIAVGTPGRLKHLITEKLLPVNTVRLFVLDEVDKLTESSFLNDIHEIYNNLNSKKQIITTSATYPQHLQNFLCQYMLSPTFITSEINSPLLLGLKQFVKIIDSQTNIIQQIRVKNEILTNILSKISFTQCLVFSNYQSRAESISNFLNQNGWSSCFISAAQTQNERLTALSSLKDFKCRIMLSTDLTSRGIDAPNVDLVINYDIPADAMTYLHRMGRAGRFGSSGICINMTFKDKELQHLQNILGCIGGIKLNIPIFPEFVGSLADFIKLDVPEDQYISAVVNDEIEDAIRGKILELKANKFEENKLKRIRNKKNSESTTNMQSDEANIDKEQAEVEGVKKQLDNMDTNDILNALAAGSFDFEMKPNENSLHKLDVSCDIEQQKYIVSPKSANKTNFHISSNTLSEGSTNQKENLLCRNKALFALTKILDSPNKNAFEGSCISDYLNLLKKQEKEAMQEMTKQETSQADQLKENINEDNTSLFAECDSVDRRSEIMSNAEEDETICLDLEEIFKLGYNSIVKSNGDAWQKWVKLRREKEIRVCNEEFNQEYYANEEQEEGNVEIMKWVPVKEKCKQNYIETPSSAHMDWMSVPKQPQNQLQQACVAEANTVDLYENYSHYFDNSSRQLRQNGVNFENVNEFDDWFTYEWETHLYTIRNYIQQNIYVQEMSKFQHNGPSGSGSYPP